MAETVLKIRNLRTSFRIAGEYHAAVDGVSLDINKNEVLAIVGESGSGKSAMALSITKLHNSNYTRIEGDVFYGDEELVSMSESKLNAIRGGHISMIFQDSISALNPLFRVGAQIDEVLSFHTKLNADKRKARTLELLDAVGIANPALAYTQYPYELSGGMRQRVMIAMAISCNPEVIIADEPTTALDVTIQAQILDLLRKLQKEIQSSIVLITHDLGVVAEMADRVAVMYAGQIVELASVWDLFENPQHPYTRSLVESIPNMGDQVDRLHVIQGLVPPLHLMPRDGCRFRHRTPWAPEDIHEANPTYHEVNPGHFVLCSCYKEFSFEGRDKQSAKMKNEES